MILVPFLVLFMLTDLGGEANRYIALAIFVVASVTDWFDGKLARKYNLVTNFGKFMDPLADKLLVCSAMICFIELEKLPAWFVIIIIGREFIISGFRLIAAENGVVIAANYWGKFKTVSQMIMIILLLIDLGGVFDLHCALDFDLKDYISACLKLLFDIRAWGTIIIFHIPGIFKQCILFDQLLKFIPCTEEIFSAVLFTGTGFSGCCGDR